MSQGLHPRGRSTRAEVLLPRRVLLVSAAVVLSASSAAAPASTATAGPAAAPPAAATDVFRRFAGTWDATMQVVGPPGQPPAVLNGIEINTTGGGGLWVTGDFRSQIEGRPFQGHALLTWDTASGKFRRLWADSTSPVFWISEGGWDPKTSTLTMWIETRNSGGNPVRWREETVFQDEGRIFTMYVPGPTTVEAAAMTITYHRRPATAKVPPAGGPAPAPAGPEMAALKGIVGAFSTRVEDRTGRTEDIKATETNTWCCDGQFIVSELSGTAGKRPYAAQSVYAYDPEQRRYERASVDTEGTSLQRVEGLFDPATATLTFHLDLPDGHGGTTHANEAITWKENGERTATVTEEAAAGKILKTARSKKER